MSQRILAIAPYGSNVHTHAVSGQTFRRDSESYVSNGPVIDGAQGAAETLCGRTEYGAADLLAPAAVDCPECREVMAAYGPGIGAEAPEDDGQEDEAPEAPEAAQEPQEAPRCAACGITLKLRTPRLSAARWVHTATPPVPHVAETDAPVPAEAAQEPQEAPTVPMRAEDVAHRIGATVVLADGRTRTLTGARFHARTVTLLYAEGPSDTYRRSALVDTRGAEPWPSPARVTCPRCYGSGGIYVGPDPFDRSERMSACPDCGGLGEIPDPSLSARPARTHRDPGDPRVVCEVCGSDAILCPGHEAAPPTAAELSALVDGNPWQARP